MRMVTPGSTTGLNVATIGGQPVILASKTQGTMAGQVCSLRTTTKIVKDFEIGM